MYSDIDPDDCEFITMLSVGFVVVTFILLVFGLFNHVLLLHIIVAQRRKMRSLSTIYITNMAVLGLCFLAIFNGGNLVIFGQVAFQVKIITGAALESGLYLIQAVSYNQSPQNSSETQVRSIYLSYTYFSLFHGIMSMLIFL